ncbi:hypothetical protein DERP_013219 [Dermatophagoides pteronyssinus]|uniref:Uncharacterized protein n=1 Tax=Dermatophagoides pteronyssinus TaxID=6956 RepID=A0ABQ8IRG5_DERPT|nr:hypothetical protein DERP_013219 [Dermatophagoides pteronyssinus]
MEYLVNHVRILNVTSESFSHIANNITVKFALFQVEVGGLTKSIHVQLTEKRLEFLRSGYLRQEWCQFFDVDLNLSAIFRPIDCRECRAIDQTPEFVRKQQFFQINQQLLDD